MKYKFYLSNTCFLILTAMIFLTGCDSGKKPNQDAFMESLDIVAASGPKISLEIIERVLQQIPSPLEISNLLKEAGTDYDAGMLNSIKGISNYYNNYKQAMNFGVYGTDLGYTNIFEKSSDGLDYLSGIKNLAEELNISQFFDLGTIKKLATIERI